MPSNLDRVLQQMSRYSGDKPPIEQHIPSISPDAIALVGLVIVQWGYLMATVEFWTEFYMRHPNVPESLRAQPAGSGAKDQLRHLQRLAEYALAEEREHSVELFDANISRIFNVKPVRDNLAHGSFIDCGRGGEKMIRGSSVSGQRLKKFTYSHEKIEWASRTIGECNAFFGAHRYWVNYEVYVDLATKLHGQN